jgi:hypothetical protein
VTVTNTATCNPPVFGACSVPVFAQCPAGTAPAGCMAFPVNSCPDGSVGIIGVFLNGPNGCGARMYNASPLGGCGGPGFTGFVTPVNLQLQCIDIP